MSYKETLKNIKNIFKIVETGKNLPDIQTKASLVTLDSLDSELDLLLKDDISLVQAPINYVNEIVRLIIVLDISYSMKGTEDDIYLGLSDVVSHHKHENILFNFVVFNGERYMLLDDVYIDNVVVPEITVSGSTNLNGSLYHTINNKCNDGVNLVVTISDGDDNVNEVTANQVKELIKERSNKHNHFYFLGEPNEEQEPEDVYRAASLLGFQEDNISVFTRKGNGNRLNFEVISKMLDELLAHGSISKTWSNPIKEHYLALTDKRC